MALERWRPRGLARSPFRELAREMEETFGRFFPASSEERGGYPWTPAVDMVDEKDAIVVKVDLPGLDQKDIEVTVQDGTLTIRGERKEEKEEKKDNYYCSERSYGAFLRSLPLPQGVEADQVKATFKNGVLQVRLPKAKEAKGKTVEIKAE